MTEQQDQQILTVLHELLRAERQSLLHRVSEAELFVPPGGARLGRLIDDLAAQQRANLGELTELVVALSGSDPPQARDPSTGSLHYLGLDYVVPLLLQDVAALAAAYRRAVERLPQAWRPRGRIARMQRRWQDALPALQQAAQASVAEHVEPPRTGQNR